MICPECHGNGFLQGGNGQIDCQMCRGSGDVQVRKTITHEAGRLITGDRAETHGPVGENFENIGALWAGYLGTPVSQLDVGNMLTLLKIARTKTNPTHRDNYVDGAGYLALNGELNLIEENK
tara:strand:+ start:759 stop:1124 length:366 start_codon:yes stop_codon:yes gene_type:complete